VLVSAGRLQERHEFPAAWRLHAQQMLPLLQPGPSSSRRLSPLAAHEHLVAVARALPSRDRLTLVFTGPLTNLAAALDLWPELEQRIERLFWMGGALDVPGNVCPPEAPGADGSAEWNCYW
jgi:purine nucleosidase